MMIDASHIKQIMLTLLAGSLGAILFRSMFTNTSIGVALGYLTPYPFLMIGQMTGIGTVVIMALLATFITYLLGTGQLAIYFLALLVIPSLIVTYTQEQDATSFINKISRTILSLSLYFIGLMIVYNYLLYFQDSSLEMAILNLQSELLVNLESLKTLNAENHVYVENAVNLYFSYLPAFTVISLLMIFFLNWFLSYKTVKTFIKKLASPGKIAAIDFPFWIFIAFIGSSVGFLFPSAKISFILQNTTMIFAFLYLLKGVALTHLLINVRMTRLKMLAYAMFYVILLTSIWFSLFIIILGIIDHFLPIRKQIDYNIQF